MVDGDPGSNARLRTLSPASPAGSQSPGSARVTAHSENRTVPVTAMTFGSVGFMSTSVSGLAPQIDRVRSTQKDVPGHRQAIDGCGPGHPRDSPVDRESSSQLTALQGPQKSGLIEPGILGPDGSGDLCSVLAQHRSRGHRATA